MYTVISSHQTKSKVIELKMAGSGYRVIIRCKTTGKDIRSMFHADVLKASTDFNKVVKRVA